MSAEDEHQMVLDALRTAGLALSSLGELVNMDKAYPEAIPVLLKFLPVVKHENVKMAITRSLTVREARGIAAVPLVQAFLKVPEAESAVKWTIGNALAVVADDSVYSEISEIVRDKRNGSSREMVVEALGNMKNPGAVDVLIELLSDEEVAGHAIVALGRLGSEKAQPDIEPFLQHNMPWIAKEAHRALKKIQRKKARDQTKQD